MNLMQKSAKKTVEEKMKLANRNLAELIFGRVLDTDNLHLPQNHESIARFVNYDYAVVGSDAQLTVGYLATSDPIYVADAIEKVFGAKSEMTPVEFLADFFDMAFFIGEKPIFKFHEAFAKHENEGVPRYFSLLSDFIVRRQMPFENVGIAIGIYIVQKAEEAGLVAIERNMLRRIC